MENDPREVYLSQIELRQNIGGRFIDIRRLGSDGGGGHFSFLFSATDSTTGARVALKVMNPERAEPYRMLCFFREEQVLKMLSDEPGIVRWVAPRSAFTMDLMTADGSPAPYSVYYYALELAKKSVQDAVLTEIWTPARKLETFRAMCRAVRRIHSQRIVHRDIKPGNFLIVPSGEIKLSDFGTAYQIGGPIAPIKTEYGCSYPGDYSYVSPEMIAGVFDLDPTVAYKGDMYALGAVLFELFTANVLNLQVYEEGFAALLGQAMLPIVKGKRQEIFDELIAGIAVQRPLPSVTDYGMAVPPSIQREIDTLCRSMAAIDYRSRQTDLLDVIRTIDRMLLILRNEDGARRLRSERTGTAAREMSANLGAKREEAK